MERKPAKKRPRHAFRAPFVCADECIAGHVPNFEARTFAAGSSVMDNRKFSCVVGSGPAAMGGIRGRLGGGKRERRVRGVSQVDEPG